jgi:hypothetical protein
MARAARGQARFAGLLLAGLLGCGQRNVEFPVSLADGTYRVTGAIGSPASDQARLLAVTATLDRASGRMVFTLADGSTQALDVTFLPRSGWAPDCPTMASHTLNEVATLAPAPLRLESLSFATPTIHPKCWSGRLLLSSGTTEAPPVLIFDLQ